MISPDKTSPKKEKLEIYQSKMKLFYTVLLSGILILYILFGPFHQTQSYFQQSWLLTIVVVIILFLVFIYSLHELIKGLPEIILTEDGIELRGNGFYNWDMIECFKTTYSKSSDHNSEELVLHLKESADIKIGITMLEVYKTELINQILVYKGCAPTSYIGHIQEQ